MEKFICGKSEDGCGDGIFISENFIAVIDGVTPKGNKKWNGKKGDEYAKDILIQKLETLPKDISAIDMMNALNSELKHANEGLDRAEWLRATIIIYSKYHKEIWSLGDCKCMINGKSHQSSKKVDELMNELRSFAIQSLLKSGMTEEEIKQNDIGREMILPFLKLQQYLENDSSEYGYSVLNGEQIREEQIDIYKVKDGDLVILASDGYPKLFPTLEESEAYLKEILKEDPLCYKKNKATKGIKEKSFDDRTYMRFEVGREFIDSKELTCMNKRDLKTRPKPNKKNRYKDSRIGLHCHCEENVQALKELLETALQENVRYLAITNHRSLKIYTEILAQLSPEDLKRYSSIKLIPGVEMSARFPFKNLDGEEYGIETHILGYGLDISKEKILDDFVREKYQSSDQEEELKRLVKIGKEIGLQFDEEDAYLDENDGNRAFAGRAFMQAVMKNMEANFNAENEADPKKLSFELRTNWGAFYNRCVKDIHSPFYFDVTSLNPTSEEVISLIHQMGGKAYLAHPSSYFAKNGTPEQVKRAYDDTVEFTRQFIEKHSAKGQTQDKIDGIEMYHPSYLNNMYLFGKMRTLLDWYRERTSGGTDVHIGNIKTSQKSISDDSKGGNLTIRKLKRFSFLQKAAQSIYELRNKVRSLKGMERD